jgi:glycosyltransferase involved in cell wall biosynthesis
MRVVIVTTQIPFVYGGAEILAKELMKAIIRAGHKAEIVAIPFKWYPPERILDNMLACRLLDLTESNGEHIDRVIGLKFPAYFVPHPNKVLWILHQHRTAYDLWDAPFCDLILFPNGRQVRDAIHNADREFIREATRVYTISDNVSKRLKSFCAIDSTSIYHPPCGAEAFYGAEPDDYFFFPSRLTRVKRQDLVIEALSKTRNSVQVYFAGVADYSEVDKELKAFVAKLGLQDRIRWLGLISEREKRRLYARSIGVLFTPYDEDYGYVTLEAMLSCKPVITCRDSGGPLEFVRHEENGLVVEPTAEAMAEAMDRLWADRALSKRLGQSGRALYEDLNITWENVLQRLLS